VVLVVRSGRTDILFPGWWSWLSKTNSLTFAIFIDELNSRRFKGLPNGGFIRSRNGDLALYYLDPANGCDSNF